ncbi:4Fe-4S ferredoxin [Candidatus Wirthbacteria bacterium CG2_30_54_11]|uniref:4Fe-4S ferredoxin n=1 Tax=Candidatus Wirthbacteria bacterium CG2_30_54_11 TaxID=1817892 RepID=A0A1J5IR47_9BACT|nr:MAG: 4Fe-4S ferredoxin [Candidatus Wirthbacteria bacterium CG2_30_54_11]
MKRKIIRIDEEACTGCALCIPNCPEGAIQVIDGKARLVSDLMCDGLGACLGHCPEGAITIEEREAEAYDEAQVMANIVKQGANTIKAHLNHLRDHGQTDYFEQAKGYLMKHGIEIPSDAPAADVLHAHAGGGCPGSRSMSFAPGQAGEAAAVQPSQLTHWPIQLHLISPDAPQYAKADVLLAADCVAFSLGQFHTEYLKGKALAIACPKLDSGKEIYLEKLRSLVDDSLINTLTVMIMQVPCCGGLLELAKQAAASAKRKIPLKYIVVSLQGGILAEEWV